MAILASPSTVRPPLFVPSPLLQLALPDSGDLFLLPSAIHHPASHPSTPATTLWNDECRPSLTHRYRASSSWSRAEALILLCPGFGLAEVRREAGQITSYDHQEKYDVSDLLGSGTWSDISLSDNFHRSLVTGPLVITATVYGVPARMNVIGCFVPVNVMDRPDALVCTRQRMLRICHGP